MYKDIAVVVMIQSKQFLNCNYFLCISILIPTDIELRVDPAEYISRKLKRCHGNVQGFRYYKTIKF